jgi:hypothetical protein
MVLGSNKPGWGQIQKRGPNLQLYGRMVWCLLVGICSLGLVKFNYRLVELWLMHISALLWIDSLVTCCTYVSFFYLLYGSKKESSKHSKHTCISAYVTAIYWCLMFQTTSLVYCNPQQVTPSTDWLTQLNAQHSTPSLLKKNSWSEGCWF